MEEVLDDLIDKFWKNDRVLEIRQLADEHGWGFTPRERFAEQPTALKAFRLFDGKRGKRITGMMQPPLDKTGFHTRVYDYIYYGDGGKKKTTVIELQSDELDLPAFHMKPKRGLARLFSRTGRKRTASDPDYFTTKYIIETSDPEAIEIQIPNSALNVISDCNGLTIEGEGNILLYYYYRKLIPVHEILHEYSTALKIMDRLLYDREKEFV
jgi:cephalosporin-C deacetylase-like acetyl esterase